VSITAGLYIVSTPIGNLADISERAIAVLREVDIIAAEDTRHSRVLFNRYTISTPCISLHDHNEERVVSTLVQRLQAGEAVALISDAGTPLISDPGYRLVKTAHQMSVNVIPVPGASALIAALSVSGLPSDRFSFEGFLPAKSTNRRQALDLLKADTRTLIFYESPHRILESLQDMASIFGQDRRAVLARELTKLYETILRDTLGGLCEQVQQDVNQQKGEMVVLIDGAEVQPVDTTAVQQVLRPLLAALPLKQAVALAVQISGEKKNIIYEQALAIKDEDDGR